MSTRSLVRPHSRHHAVALITDAPVPYTEQHDERVRKYLLLMSFRIPALIVAAILYSVTGLWWVSLAVIAVSVPLPWMAVLIANDGPPRDRQELDRYLWGAEATRPAIAAPTRRSIEG